MKRFFLVVAVVLAVMATLANAVTLTPYNKHAHRAAVVLGIDDYVKSAYLDTAEALGVPITWFIAPYYNDTRDASGATLAARLALLDRAHALNHEIAAHTGPCLIDTMTEAEVRFMFEEARRFVKKRTGEYPVSWTYHGNDWDSVTQGVIRDYYPGLIRLRTNSHDTLNSVIQTAYQTSPTVTALPDNPKEGGTSIGVDWTYTDGPHPLPQIRMDRVVYTPATLLCDNCNNGATTDTTDMADFFYDLVKIHGVAVTSLHSQGYDISNHQFGKLIRTGLARGDIWFCTARQFYEQFGAALDEDEYGTIHVSATADTMGAGSLADPAPLRWVYQCWGQDVQLKDEVYPLEQLVGPTMDFRLISNLTVKGPATILANMSSTTHSNTFLTLAPTAGAWTGYHGGFDGVTFWADSVDADTDTDISITADNGFIRNCTFTSACGNHISSGTASVDSVKILNNYFLMDSTITQSGISRTGATCNGWAIIGNEFKYGSDGTGTKYGVYVETAMSTTDTLANNRFINEKDAATFYAFRRTAVDNVAIPRYRFVCAGNEVRGATAANLSVYLKGGARDFTPAILDSIGRWTETNSGWALALADTFKVAKNWYGLGTGVSDTTRFGGVPLAYMGTASRWGSIGADQAPAPCVSAFPLTGKLAASRTRIESPWRLSYLVDAGVLPASDSLNQDTWYPIFKGVTDAEKAQYDYFMLDWFNDRPLATREKVTWMAQ